MNRIIDFRRDYDSRVKAFDDLDEDYTYFLDVLKKIRNILKSRCSIELMNDHLIKSAHDNVEVKQSREIHNIFSKLHVQEFSKKFTDASDVTSTNMIENKSRLIYEVETLQTREKEYLIAHCLLQNVRDIRRFTCEL